MRLLFYIILVGPLWLSYCSKNDYYDLLGVSRDATVREIRKAFKNLAVKLHPDKNKDDVNADEKFVKLARAYEILKDADSRKNYDIYGDTESSPKKQQYHSYTYYRDQFGIYDDDPLIVTLSRNDYEVNVLDNNQAWFVNFYSPNCHHCHELAPAWRKLASELEGVIRIGAVNCEDDWALCHQMSITAYPSLIYYEKQAHLLEGVHYKGSRTFDGFKEFVLSKVNVDIRNINLDSWETERLNEREWLLFLCSKENICPETETITKLAATLEGLLYVGLIESPDLCKLISESYNKNPIIFWKIDKEVDKTNENSKAHVITGSDTKEILDNILNLLPNPDTLDEEKFQDIRTQLRLGDTTPWLICFYLGPATELNLQLKRLPTLIPHIKIGLIHCGRSSGLCSALHIARYPTWGVIKVGGAFELHHGRDVLHDVATFARDSVKSTNLHALSPADFLNIKSEGGTWFIDWYAPWCPPCRKLMPELRKASQHFDSEKVQFGTVDCTLHRGLCSKQGITSYPTTILYNGSQTHHFHGVPNEDGIVEFVNDMLNPPVLQLDDDNFYLLQKKSKKEIWVVDFYAPWCGPCQRLAPEFRKLAKQVKDIKEVKIVGVDCVANSAICNAQNIRSYPTIRLYPLGSKGLNTVALYNGNHDVTSLKRWILGFLPSSVESLSASEFKKEILTKNFELPWLIDFYAPWCGHCVHFEPEFRLVAQKLERQIRSGKVDCQAEQRFCSSLYINSYPTVMLYLSPTQKYPIRSQDANEIIKQVKSIINENQKLSHDEL